ncbi:MAG: hypothetical protein KJ072_01590 [Verrucomicrobia bacterium]|nr:hypothetical protein [Verrucomicrobiota bacterium]
MRTEAIPADPHVELSKLNRWLVAIGLFAMIGLSIGCQTRQPVSEIPPAAIEPALVPAPTELTTELTTELIVLPTRVTTNELHHVTYTFELPRPSARGYVIQESLDGVNWTELGRSTATHFTRITFKDSTPSSGKQYRVSLP